MFIRNFLLASTIALAGLGVAGCGTGGEESSETVNVGAVSSDLTVEPLYQDGTVTPVAIMGTYGRHCKMHRNEAWELTLNDPDDRDVEVVLNDTFGFCPLTLTGIKLRRGHSHIAVDVEPPIVLGLDFAVEPAEVNFEGGALVFYTNATINGLEEPRYTNDFSIHMIYSDDAEICRQFAPPAIYATVSASADGEAVPPPDYAMGFDGLQLVVDAWNIVQDESVGSVVLRAGQQPAEEWKLFDRFGLCCGGWSFADIDHLYKSGDEIAGDEMAHGDIGIDWSHFGLLGERLPQWRVLVLKHTGEGGVYSYEMFQVIFPGPRTYPQPM